MDFDLTMPELHKKLAAREVSARELCQAMLTRLKDYEPELKAFITLTEKEALKKASEVDSRIEGGGKLSSLAGIPFALKDALCTEGIRTTCGSKTLEGHVPVYTATAARRLFDADAVLLGKTNMDEFAMGSSTETSFFYPTRNPWDTERSPGGSSGGSAAAVAAGQAIYAIGSDTGGSIRQPASLCGVVGFKPTYGLVSRYGLVAFASSLDQVGPLTNNVTDCAVVMNTLAGHDELDSTSVKADVPDYTASLVDDMKGLKVGVPKELMVPGLEGGVRAAFENALNTFEEAGAVVNETSLPSLEHSLSAYYMIAAAEASSNLARFDGVRYGLRTDEADNLTDMYTKTRRAAFGDEVKRRVMLGTYVLSAGYYDAYYGQAQKARTLVVRDFEKAFAEYDVLVSPTTPTTAFKIGEKVDDPLQMYLSDICTAPVNLAGLPAISVPCGLAAGLPVGLQIIGKPLSETTVFRAAFGFEQSFGFNDKPGFKKR